MFLFYVTNIPRLLMRNNTTYGFHLSEWIGNYPMLELLLDGRHIIAAYIKYLSDGSCPDLSSYWREKWLVGSVEC